MADNETRELESEIFELERYIEDLWQFYPTPLAYINPQGIIMDVDLSLIKFLGYPKEELIGTPLADFSPQKEIVGAIERETMEKGFVRDRETLLLDKAGKAVTVSLTTSVRKDQAGSIFGYFVSLIDLSTIKMIQHELEEKMSELKEFHDLAVGRELKMIELEKDINKLLAELGREPKYK